MSLVSICIPAHNDAQVIGDALGSAMRQDYPELEILVLDNNSTDQTSVVVAQTGAGDSRVRYVRHPEDLGMAANFSACVAQARGELILVLCSDDALEDGCVKALAAKLLAYKDAVLVACSRIITDAALNKKRVVRAPEYMRPVARDLIFRRCFARGNVIGEPSAVMFRRDAALRGFDARFSQTLDLEMWLHLLERGTAVFVPDALCRIRQHPGQATRANLKSGRIVDDKRLLFTLYGSRTESLTWLDKLAWDARMASSVVRSKAQGAAINEGAISEVFFRRLFRRVLVPVIGAVWR